MGHKTGGSCTPAAQPPWMAAAAARLCIAARGPIDYM